MNANAKIEYIGTVDATLIRADGSHHDLGQLSGPQNHRLIGYPADSELIGDTGVFSGPCELTLVNGAERYELNAGTLRVTANVGTP